MNFSVFFFLHFQGFSRRPRVANLLRRRLGGVWPLGITDSERMADSLSTSSAAREQNQVEVERQRSRKKLQEHFQGAQRRKKPHDLLKLPVIRPMMGGDAIYGGLRLSCQNTARGFVNTLSRRNQSTYGFAFITESPSFWTKNQTFSISLDETRIFGISC